MRELIAKLVTALTVAVVVGLSLLFAAKHNSRASATAPPPPHKNAAPVAMAAEGRPLRPTLPDEAVPPAAKTPADIARGRAVYAQQNCAACHSIAGEGNPRAPLDGVGARLDAAELRAWITGTGAAADVLAPAIVKRKQRYLSIPADEPDALIAYLSTLRPAK